MIVDNSTEMWHITQLRDIKGKVKTVTWTGHPSQTLISRLRSINLWVTISSSLKQNNNSKWALHCFCKEYDGNPSEILHFINLINFLRRVIGSGNKTAHQLFSLKFQRLLLSISHRRKISKSQTHVGDILQKHNLKYKTF